MQTEAEAELSPSECQDLRHIAGIMIPANEEFGVPGADDAIIFADIVRSIGRDLDEVPGCVGGAHGGLRRRHRRGRHGAG